MTAPKPMTFPPDAKKVAEDRSALLREIAALKPPSVLNPGVAR